MARVCCTKVLRACVIATRFSLNVKTARKHLADADVEEREIRNLASTTPALLGCDRMGSKFSISSCWPGTSEEERAYAAFSLDSTQPDVAAALADALGGAPALKKLVVAGNAFGEGAVEALKAACAARGVAAMRSFFDAL